MSTAPTVSAQAVELVESAMKLLDWVMSECDDENARLLTDMFLNLAKCTQQAYVSRHHTARNRYGGNSSEAHRARMLADEYGHEALHAADCLVEEPDPGLADEDAYADEVRRTQDMEPR